MNRIKYKFIIAILLPVLFYIFISGFKETGEKYQAASNTAVSSDKEFTNILLNTSYRNSLCVWDLENHLNQYRELNFNGIHMYDWSSDKFGQFESPLTTSQINNLNELIYRSDTTGLKSIFERTKISRLCYGQRLEYEVVENTGDSLTNFGFCYKNRDNNVAYFIPDSGRTVLHSQTSPSSSPNSAGWLCKNIFENIQHTDLYYFLQSADTADWFLKPMMRIDSGDVDINPNAFVVAIVSYNFKGHKIDSTIIKARNFAKFDVLTNSYLYGGNYKNLFDFSLEGSGTDLVIPGSLDSNGTTEGLNYGYGGNSGVHGYDRYNVKQCKVDFRVYWFGQVDVWFDKMTVDDRFANKLFKGEFNDNIEQEISNFGDTLDLFFADELVYSQFPCFKYVRDYV
jgi:hypothetical protein